MSDLFSHHPDDRVLIWFSCGVTSAVATKLALLEFPTALVVRIRIDSEHSDNDRFARDVQAWVRHDITEIRSARYKDQFEVIDHSKYVNGPSGARCTLKLKRVVREAFQLPTDLHVFGFDADEADRVEDFRERNPDLRFRSPLVEAGLSKADCKAIMGRAGLELPAMYKIGYSNNNYIGCVKGGMGYWNKIRVDFPEAFAKMAALERQIGRTAIRSKGQHVYLDTLDPSAGRFKEDDPGDCGPLCQVALEKVGLS